MTSGPFSKQYEDAFIRDTLRQLCAGLECYVFDMKTAEYIQRLYKKKTKLMFNIKQEEDGYILLVPIKKVHVRVQY